MLALLSPRLEVCRRCNQLAPARAGVCVTCQREMALLMEAMVWRAPPVELPKLRPALVWPRRRRPAPASLWPVWALLVGSLAGFALWVLLTLAQ